MGKPETVHSRITIVINIRYESWTIGKGCGEDGQRGGKTRNTEVNVGTKAAVCVHKARNHNTGVGNWKAK